MTILVLATLSVSTCAFMLGPARARTTRLERQLAGLQRELTETHRALAELTRYRREGVEIQRRWALLAQRLATEREIPLLYRHLHGVAAETGLAVALFQPKDRRVQRHYTEIPLALTAEGTYHQLGRFFERIIDLPTVVTVERLKVTGIDRPPVSLRAELILIAYAHPPIGATPAVSANAKAAAVPPS